MTDTIKPKATALIQSLAERNGGTLTPEIVLENARKKASPLHSFFCWDDTKAANEYRLAQAAHLIRRVRVTYTTPDNVTVRIRAYCNVVEPKPEGEEIDPDEPLTPGRERGIYVSVQDAMHVSDYREQILAQCRRDVETFRRKYTAIQEVEKIIAEMENFTTEIAIA
jgi:hypothetical protein